MNASELYEQAEPMHRGQSLTVRRSGLSLGSLRALLTIVGIAIPDSLPTRRVFRARQTGDDEFEVTRIW